MTKFGTWRLVFTLVALFGSVWLSAAEKDDALDELSTTVVKFAWEKAASINPENIVDRTQRAAELAKNYRDKNAERQTDDAKKKQPAYERAWKYLSLRSKKLNSAKAILDGTECKLMIVRPGTEKEDAVKRNEFTITAESIENRGELYYVPQESGEYVELEVDEKSSLPQTNKKQAAKTVVEVNFFHPPKEDAKGKPMEEVDKNHITIGVKETVFPKEEKDQEGHKLPILNYASQVQVKGNSFKEVMLIGFGPQNQYRIECK